MEFLILIIVIIIGLILIKKIYKININEIKQFGNNNKDLDEIIKKYPSNNEICRSILKKIKNEKVKIEENKENNNCLYIAVSDKIIIANMRESFTRVQTIAHECLHSIQDKRILLFNFIYSNLYLFCFYLLVMLGIIKVIPYKQTTLSIFIILSFIYYFIRSYLEDDAMIKAKFLAEEYMRDSKISEETEIKAIINKYDELNNIGIKAVNYGLFFNISIRTIILALIFFFR